MRKYIAMSFAVIAFSLLAVSVSSAADYDRAYTAPIDTTDEDFYNDVIRSYQPVIVDFWAPWCGHCRKMAKTMDELAAELSGKVKVVKINVDKYHETANKYKVNGIPAFFYFKNGKQVGFTAGEMSKEELKRKLGL